jgi:hypothetical protein
MMESLARVLIELGILSALVAFLTKRWSDRYAADLNAKHARELEVLRARLGAASHITSAQFDAEFKAVALIWNDVHRLREAMARVCVRSGRMVGDEPSDAAARNEWYTGRMNALREHRNSFANDVHAHEPFYSPELYQAFGGLIDIADEALQRQWRDFFTSEWFDWNEERLDRFLAGVQRANAQVQQRLGGMGLVERGR